MSFEHVGVPQVPEAFAITAAGSLSNRVESSRRSIYDGKIEIYPGFNKLRADEPTPASIFQPLTYCGKDFAAVVRAHPRAQVEAVRGIR